MYICVIVWFYLLIQRMKDFVKYTLATLCGLFLASIALFTLGILSIAGMMTMESTAPSIKPQSVLRLTLNGELQEDAPNDPLGDLFGSTYPTLSLREIQTAIQGAKENPNIDGIYIEAQTLLGATPAMIRDIRESLADFKKSGKYIIAYGDNYTQGAYYICSIADSIILNPQGQVNWCGMASQPIFYKDLLEKIGIKMQVFKVGSYKSAVEPFTATQMSDANREQVTSYLNDIWQTMLTDVSRSRSIKKDLLDEYADSMLTFRPAEELVRNGMVDSLCYIDGISRMLRAKTGKDKGALPLVSVKELAAATETTPKKGDKIAVYYAYGDIVDRKTEWSENVIDAETVCHDLRTLREDESVKAVVLRINSGGGSAYASEQIWHEVKLLRKAKPVVVSMGGMAASGGYYISCAANYIVAEPTTLTGSIGIFGLIPDASQLLSDKLGLHFDVVKTNSHADFGTPARPFNPSEAQMMQGYIQRGYKLFTERVAEGRNMETGQVEKLAEGRVWTGQQAVGNGLADANGNLQTAIKKAASLAKIKDYHTEYAPTPAPWYEGLFDQQKKDYLNTALQETLGTYYAPLMNLRQIRQMSVLQARIPYEPNFIN